jgi:hypothetical protein
MIILSIKPRLYFHTTTGSWFIMVSSHLLLLRWTQRGLWTSRWRFRTFYEQGIVLGRGCLLRHWLVLISSNCSCIHSWVPCIDFHVRHEYRTTDVENLPPLKFVEMAHSRTSQHFGRKWRLRLPIIRENFQWFERYGRYLHCRSAGSAFDNWGLDCSSSQGNKQKAPQQRLLTLSRRGCVQRVKKRISLSERKEHFFKLFIILISWWLILSWLIHFGLWTYTTIQKHAGRMICYHLGAAKAEPFG